MTTAVESDAVKFVSGSESHDIVNQMTQMTSPCKVLDLIKGDAA